MRRVKTLAPGGGVLTHKLTSPQPSDQFGAVGILALLTAAGKAAAKAGLGKKIQAMLKDEQRRIDIYERRYKSSKKRFERARTDSAKRRNLRSMLRYRELMEVALLKRSLASSGQFEPGVMLDGAAIESRRNALIKELGGSSPERKKHLEQIIKGYEEQLDKIQAQVQQATPALSPAPAPAPAPSGSKAQYIAPMVDERVQRIDRADEGSELLRQTMLTKPSMSPDDAVVSGVGGLKFIAESPPGPGQQVRVSFYPTNPADSYSGANGIVVPGDDPVLLMRGTYTANNQTFLRLPDFQIRTDLMDFGTYRFLGLQCHPQGNYKIFQNAGTEREVQLLGLAITIRSIQIYNGQEMLLPGIGEMDVETFNLFPTRDRLRGLTGGLGDTGFQQTPYNITRSDRFFVGLRTNPVVEGTARVRAIVSAYVYNSTNVVAGDFIEIPLSTTIIGQMFEDKVFGNTTVVTPAARAGAQVNVGLRDEGVDSQGVRQYRLRNPRYTPPGD